MTTLNITTPQVITHAVGNIYTANKSLYVLAEIDGIVYMINLKGNAYSYEGLVCKNRFNITPAEFSSIIGGNAANFIPVKTVNITLEF